MKVRVEGQFLSAEPWSYQGYEGYSVSILQDTASAKLSVRKEDAPGKWPERLAPVVIEGEVRPGYDGKGFKVRVTSFQSSNGKVG